MCHHRIPHNSHISPDRGVFLAGDVLSLMVMDMYCISSGKIILTRFIRENCLHQNMGIVLTNEIKWMETKSRYSPVSILAFPQICLRTLGYERSIVNRLGTIVCSTTRGVNKSSFQLVKWERTEYTMLTVVSTLYINGS